MTKITSEHCINLIKEKFPKFLNYWDAFVRDFGSDNGIHTQMLPLGAYTLDLIKSNDEIELKKILDFVEILICNGDDAVQSAMTTAYLEYLMSKDPDEIQFSKCVKYLGENAIGYCRAWDEFTGVRTAGLWEKGK